MSAVRRNLVANYLGHGWAAVMGLAFIPLYIRYLGIEAYGLIGIYAVLQAWLTLLDAGITPTLLREMARFSGGARDVQSIRNLLHSLELICFSLAVVVAIGIWSASEYLANSWFQASKLPPAAIAQAVSVMALVIALRLCEGIYVGCLHGLQRQVWYNGVNAVLVALRYGGAVAVLAGISATIEVFFLWQAAVSLLAVAILASAVHRSLPSASTRPTFSPEVLSGISSFALSMMGITFLALLLTQMDKILLSRLLPLESFGYYTLAATVAGALYLIISPVVQAVYPRMVEISIGTNEMELAALYHLSVQLVTVLAAPATILFIFFPEGVIFLWSGDVHLAKYTAPILSVLALGTFLHSLMWMPYHVRLAHGWTSLTLKVNTVAVLILIPAVVWAAPRYGAVGVAWLWVALNVGYVLVPIQLMHRRLLRGEKLRWYFSDVMLPAAGAMVVAVLAGKVQPVTYEDRWQWLVFILVTGGLATVASVALADVLRSRILSLIQLHRHRRYS